MNKSKKEKYLIPWEHHFEYFWSNKELEDRGLIVNRGVNNTDNELRSGTSLAAPILFE